MNTTEGRTCVSALKQGAHMGAPLQESRIEMDGYTNMKRAALFLTLTAVMVLALLAGATAASAQSERILNFKSFIKVHPDASMTVTEDITVQATGQEIKRGIIRDFPTTYRDRLGNTVTVGFKVEEVLRDGRPEPYHTQSVSNGVKIFIGQKDVFLQAGVYTYTIRYRVDRELGFFKDFDELYWNVTGNGWTFAIDRAEAYIELPAGAKILKSAAYTGYQGDRGHDFTVHSGDNLIVFKTTRPLASREGLTVAVSWPKGVVHEPSSQERMGFFFQDNVATAIGLIWLAVLLGFYLWVWYRVGRDPAAGTIIPLYSPPAGFSPAGVRFVSRMGYDDKAFAAAVVDMAVKGAVQIKEDDGDYTLVPRDVTKSALSTDEQLVTGQLFPGGKSVKLENTNHTIIKSAIDVLKKNLQEGTGKDLFRHQFRLPGAGNRHHPPGRGLCGPDLPGQSRRRPLAPCGSPSGRWPATFWRSRSISSGRRPGAAAA